MFTAFLINFDVTELLNDGVKKGGLGQNMNYDNDICILHMYLSAGVHISRRDARHGLKLGQGTMEI